MKVLYLDDNSKFDSSSLVIALGFFDGFHKAHMELLKETIKISKDKNRRSAILTFNESITSIIKNEKYEYLTSIDDKVSMALKLGFDELVLIEPTPSFINMSHIDFYNKYLKDADTLVLGFDYSFGKDRLGNYEYLRSRKDNVVVIDEIKIGDTKIGTYEIKKALSLGDINKANEFLGRTYSSKGFIYKRNKYYALSMEDYSVPRNGIYNLHIVGPNIDLEFNAKIKRLVENNSIIIKPLDYDLSKCVFEKRKVYEVFFTETSSKSL